MQMSYATVAVGGEDAADAPNLAQGPPGAHTPAPAPDPGAPPAAPGGAAPDLGLEGEVPPDPEVPPEEMDQPEPSKGTGLLVGGIILTSAVTVIGGIAYLNLEPKNLCNG